MITVLSPAKTLDMESPACVKTFTEPEHADHAAELIDVLKAKTPAEIGKLMSISEKLSTLNAGRYQAWDRTFTEENAKQAVLAFQGDVYQGLQAGDFTGKQFTYAQKHLRILSGLYGVLRPLDLMQPYRLEMGTRLQTERGGNLYAFWGMAITDSLNEAIETSRSKALINLASQEYFKSVKPGALAAPVITPVFKDKKKGVYKIVAFWAKKARGRMAAYQITEGLKDPEGLKEFTLDGYVFEPTESTEREWVFHRDAPPEK